VYPGNYPNVRVRRHNILALPLEGMIVRSTARLELDGELTTEECL